LETAKAGRDCELFAPDRVPPWTVKLFLDAVSKSPQSPRFVVQVTDEYVYMQGAAFKILRGWQGTLRGLVREELLGVVGESQYYERHLDNGQHSYFGSKFVLFELTELGKRQAGHWAMDIERKRLKPGTPAR
jgi:hypothetical protein